MPIIGLVLLSVSVFASEPKTVQANNVPQMGSSPVARIGDYPFPTNPISDRAIGYILQGKAKSALGNYGNFINWDEHPAGMWGDYTYLPSVAFLAGVKGHQYAAEFAWEYVSKVEDSDGAILYQIWESRDAYADWYSDNGDTNYVGILFEADRDDGRWNPDSVAKKMSVNEISGAYQWGLSEDNGALFISLLGELDPSEYSSRVGLIYPWALRPALKERTDDFDLYNYGNDNEEWTKDDVQDYYGATVGESWFTRWDPSTNTDWHASTMSRINTHNTEVDAGTIFGETDFTDPTDTYPVLAHSAFSQTWPLRFVEETNGYEPYWPGWWSQNYNVNLPGCDGSRLTPECWEPVPGRFISDMDVYMEFDDRWAHRGNNVNTNNEYEQTGYPLGLKVMAEAHSYGVSYAEDILFVTVKVRNESGDWSATDENGDPVLDINGVQKTGEGMIMPDGTKLNRGKGFNYQDLSLGFYMDADVLVGDIGGYNSGLHTNDDDFMEYYDCATRPEGCQEINGQPLRVSMAMIGDFDGSSGMASGFAMDPNTPSPGNGFGVVATQLLDTPRATEAVDLDQDGTDDILPGEPLKMTDWHWFDWYNRPGVVNREGDSNCCAGDKGKPQARNKEEILLKLMMGDTVNLSQNEKTWFFHTPDPVTDLGIALNPHFDSLEGLMEEDAFNEGEKGLDGVFIMSCGPFDLPVGREVPFSFCIIFGQDKEDLINNARFAQVMYNSRYQGFTPPSRPTLYSETSAGEVRLYWNDVAEDGEDVVTGYSDFEGYRIYKSIDGGQNWGGPDDMIYDTDGIFVGWRPMEQWDLSAYDDSVHCVYRNDDCDDGNNRGHAIQGQDPFFPWFNLGEDTGFEAIRLDKADWKVVDSDTFKYMLVDDEVVDGMEYAYAVTAYDMGVETPVSIKYIETEEGFIADSVVNHSNPDSWADPDGYASIENSKGTTVLDRNFVKVYPGVVPQDNLDKVSVVPNPYIVHSPYNETEFLKQIRFTNLPSKCQIKIFTVTGEYVFTVKHDNEESGNAIWDMRTVNNQEIAPGLYIFYVEQLDASGGVVSNHIGKFAVVR